MPSRRSNEMSFEELEDGLRIDEHALEIEDYMLLRKRFLEQRRHAKARSVPFLLTFDQWFEVWLKSGKLSKRGRKPHQYVMARFGDVGAYEIDNVAIVPWLQNHQDAHLGAKRKYRWNLTDQTRRKIRLARTGTSLSPETKRKISESLGRSNQRAEIRKKRSEAAKRREAAKRAQAVQRNVV